MIPNKSHFKFQELTPITGVKPYVIRFWETEFEDISPTTSDQGQKLYAKKDVEAILSIKKLLFEDKLSIPQAKASMKNKEVEAQDVDDAKSGKHERVLAREAVAMALEFIQELKTKHNW
jgi:DNA-binding transcriptional MerR regulator